MGPLIHLVLKIIISVVIIQRCDADDCGDKCIASVSVTSKEKVCNMSYLSALEPLENPIEDDGCADIRFTLEDGTIGPVDIPGIGHLKKDDLFSTNIREHRKEAQLLLNLFLDCKTFVDFKNAAMHYKSVINPMLYSFVFSAAIINRRDTDTFPVPGLDQIMPSHFYHEKVIHKSKRKIRKSHRRLRRKYIKRRRDFKKSKGHHERFNGRHRKKLHNDKNEHHEKKAPTGHHQTTHHQVSKAKTSHQVAKGHTGHHRSKRQADIGTDQASNQNNQEKQQPEANPITQMPLDHTGDDRNPEHKVSYFREDIGINSHHWHWHLVYPLFWINKPRRILKDRKGELFYYMHNQIVKRYNGERYAAGLKFVKPIPMTITDVIIEEGYFPNLFSSIIGSDFCGRPANLLLQNVTSHPIAGDSNIADLLNWYGNVISAINDGQVTLPDGTFLPLSEQEGINILGSAVEASATSPNPDLYGDIHNTGHVLLSFIHDPTGVFKAPQGVMGFTETALRDPVFWRWHKMVDNLLNLHKAQLPPYSDSDLTYNDITISDISITSGKSPTKTYGPNELATFFRQRVIDISRGLDFEADSSTATVNLTHLDHLPFTYLIHVNNKGANDFEGHVRIFIAPKYTDSGNLATDEELRQNSIEMDRYSTVLTPGVNTLRRFSQESAVTMTPNRQWAQLSAADVEFNPSSDNDNFCGCGWPDHLLIPKGTPKGMKYVFFVMISDWSKEKIGETETYRTCDDSLTMCGLLDKKFPDKRSMGFPLDRPIPATATDWYNRPNMIRKDVTIYHY